MTKANISRIFRERLTGLTLSRRRDEGVVICTPGGERIEIAVSNIDGDQVKLMFHAAPGISVNRSEIQLEIDMEGSRV